MLESYERRELQLRKFSVRSTSRAFFKISNWQGRVQSTVGGTIPRLFFVGSIGNQAKQARRRKQVRE